MSSTTPLPPPRVRISLPSTIAGLGLSIVAGAGRVVTVCLLTPIVLLFGVMAFVALAVVGTARLAQSSATSLGVDTRAAAADVQFYASSTAERVESVAARQAA